MAKATEVVAEVDMAVDMTATEVVATAVVVVDMVAEVGVDMAMENREICFKVSLSKGTQIHLISAGQCTMIQGISISFKYW